MENHTSLRVTKSFKISLKPLIVPHMLRRVSERGVNYEWTLVKGNKARMGLHVKGVRFNDPVELCTGEFETYSRGVFSVRY